MANEYPVKNSANRSSFSISGKQAGELIASACHAFCAGYPFTLLLTISWGRAGIKCRPQEATTDYLKAVGDWLGTGRSYVWVLEHPVGKSEHVHVLLHVPPEKIEKFLKLKDDWAGRIGATPQERGQIVDAKRITGSHPEWDVFLYLDNLKKIVRYLLKGVDIAAAPALGIVYKPQGMILSKRVGTSELLTENGRAKDEARRNLNPVWYEGRRHFRLLDLAHLSLDRFVEKE